MFDFLFKYSPVVYEQGQWIFRAMPALIILASLAAIALAMILFLYRRTTSPISPRWRVPLIVFRVLAAAVVVFCLLEPVLSVSTVVPQKSSVLILVDDSESMMIADVPPRRDGNNRPTRLQQVKNWLDDAATTKGVLR